jgi:hypothetical protein
MGMMLNGGTDVGHRGLDCCRSLGRLEVGVGLGLESWNIEGRGRMPSRELQ